MAPPTSLSAEKLSSIHAPLARANLAFAALHPGDRPDRQPVHTVYGGAQLFKADAARKLGVSALAVLEENAPDAAALAAALGMEVSLAERVYPRVLAKLQKEAVEDFRIDFEDGYGNRPDAEEDGHAVSVAQEVARGLAEKVLPPFLGIRIKNFSEELFARSARTLDLFMTALLSATRGEVPSNFVVTLPKVTVPEQVTALVRILEALEEKNGLAKGALKLELMVETPQSIIGSDGRMALPAMVSAAEGRCVGAHFGTYDYTAGCNITAAYQTMDHPACDFAKHVMQVSLALSGVALSDGATNVMPVGPHRAVAGKALTPAQQAENRAVVHRAWRISQGHIHHSLVTGYYQGWDLHPAQLPVRYATVYAFFLEGLAPASARLAAFMGKAAQATLLGDIFDDAATGQGLLNFFLRGMSCGALTVEETQATGLTVAELQTRSFVKILEARRKAVPVTPSPG